MKSKNPLEEWGELFNYAAKQLGNLANGQPDLTSFLWGMLAGGIATCVIGYFVWPYVVAALKVIPAYREMVEELKRRGII